MVSCVLVINRSSGEQLKELYWVLSIIAWVVEEDPCAVFLKIARTLWQLCRSTAFHLHKLLLQNVCRNILKLQNFVSALCKVRRSTISKEHETALLFNVWLHIWVAENHDVPGVRWWGVWGCQASEWWHNCQGKGSRLQNIYVI